MWTRSPPFHPGDGQGQVYLHRSSILHLTFWGLGESAHENDEYFGDLQETESQKPLWMYLSTPEGDHALNVRGAPQRKPKEGSCRHPFHLSVPLRESKPVTLKRPREGTTHEKAKKL